MSVNLESLIRTALDMRKKAYVPYSHFAVGAGLLAENGKIYGGCNIENAAYTPANCAERTAFFRAVSEGERKFSAIAIAGGPEGVEPPEYCAPCGVCRQVMMEFCDADTFQIILAKSETDYRVFLLRDLFPFGFGPENLNRQSEQA